MSLAGHKRLIPAVAARISCPTAPQRACGERPNPKHREIAEAYGSRARDRASAAVQ